MTFDAAQTPTCDHPTGYRRPSFDRSFFTLLAMFVVGMACLLSQISWQNFVVLCVFELTYLFGCQRTRHAVLWVAPAMILPACVSYAVASKRDDASISWIAALIIMVLFLSLVTLGRFYVRRLWLIAITALLVSTAVVFGWKFVWDWKW